MARTPVFSISENDIRAVEVDFSASCSDFDADVVSVTWSVEEGHTVTVESNTTLSGNKAEGFVRSVKGKLGPSLVKVQAVVEDGQLVSKYFKVNVVRPSC